MGAFKGKFGIRQLNMDMPYPKWEMLAGVLLLYLAPFTSWMLTIVAFALFVMRVILYNVRVFAVDYAILLPLTTLLRIGDMSVLVYLCLLATLWYAITDQLDKSVYLAILLILLNYLVLRMQWNVSNFVLCFGHLAMLCILLPRQDAASARKAAIAFCLSLIVSSAVAFVLRDSGVMQEIRGSEPPAYWGASIRRFQGMFEDPNYYMTLIVTAMALLMKLFACKHLHWVSFALCEAVLAVFGFLTYSKTFFVAVALLLVAAIVWLFLQKKYLLATIGTAVVLILLYFFVLRSSLFLVLLSRAGESGNLSDLTTGRSDVFAAYFRVITKDLPSTLFGQGMAVDALDKDPHNIYLEIAYYIGVVGLLLMAALLTSLSRCVKAKCSKKQNFLSNHLVLMMALVLFFALHGVFSTITYAIFFFAILSMLIEEAEVAEA